MSPVRGPASLQKLLDSYDANTRRCLGCSFPTHERCKNKIDSNVDDLQLALADLRSLLSLGWEDHGPGLIDKLRSIAHTFSCSKHQQTSGHTSQFTYYWLAYNILPNIVECMGFVLGLPPGISAGVDLEPRCGGPICTKDHYCAYRVQAVLDGLAISKVWLLCEAFNRLTGQWLENENNKLGPGRIRRILDARLATSNSNQDEVPMKREAEQQWNRWHLMLSSKLAVIEESPKRNNLNEELARGPSTSVQCLHLDQPRQGPDLSSQSTKFHGSAPNVLKQPKTRQKSALPRRRAVSAPQTLEPLESGLSAKNTDIGNPSGPPRHVETGTADVDETMITRPLFPNFQPLEGQRPQSTTAIAREVFDVMTKPLSDTKQLDEGRIYTLRMISRPGYVKIGRTIQSIPQRKKQISACLPYEMEIINAGDSRKVPNHTRIEALVHAELKSYRRYFKCPCRQKARGKLHDCEGNDGMTQHGEWFEIDEKKACEAVDRWRKWMSTYPYSKGKLSYYQQAQADRYANDQRRMEAMVIKDENGREHWDWTRFLKSPQWDLHILRIHKFLFGEQIIKSRRSRWDSLKEHWLQNFAFVWVMSLMFQCFLFVASYFLPPVFSNTFVSSIMSCAFVSFADILYFA